MTTLSCDVSVVDGVTSTSPPVSADVVLDGQDVWVDLTLTEDNLRQLVREVLRALKSHGYDRIMAQRGGPDVSAPALERLLGDVSLRSALTFRLSLADAEDLGVALTEHGSRVFDVCRFPDVDCWNVCAPGSLRCPVHEDTKAGAA